MDSLLFPTLQSAAQQSVQLRVDFCFLLQHVEQQLVLGGAVYLRLLQPTLHHLQLGILLSRLQTLTHDDTGDLSLETQQYILFYCLYISTGQPNVGSVALPLVVYVITSTS